MHMGSYCAAVRAFQPAIEPVFESLQLGLTVAAKIPFLLRSDIAYPSRPTAGRRGQPSAYRLGFVPARRRHEPPGPRP